MKIFNKITFIFFLVSSLFVFLGHSGKVLAQSCIGSHTFTWTQYSCAFDGTSNSYKCVSNTTASSNQTCKLGACEACVQEAGATCSGGATGCTIGTRSLCDSSSCSVPSTPTPTAPPTSAPPPTQTPAPSEGACGSCSSCGAATSSECALINGVCSKAGYCSSGSLGYTGCRIWDHAPVTVQLGQTISTVVSGFLYGDIILSQNITIATPSITTVVPMSQNLCCSNNFGDYRTSLSIKGSNFGTTWLTVRWGTSGYNDTSFCSNSFPVSVIAPIAPTLTFTGSPTSVISGGGSTLSWSTTNATSCTGSGGDARWPGGRAINNPAYPLTNLTTSADYTLTCSGLGGSVTKSVNISVISPALPTLTLSASPTSVSSGGSSTLTWTSTNATSCTASGSWSGAKTVNGTQVQTSISTNQSYTLNCTGPGGSVTKTANVNVIGSPALPTVNLTASPTSVPSAGSTTLTWSTTNATSCTASNGWSGSKLINGSQVVPNNLSNKTFTLACTGPGGTTTRSASITVTAPTCGLPAPRDPAPPVCAPNPPTQNGSITWTWPAVPGANQYSFSVVDANTGVTIGGTSTGMVNGQTNFNCRPNQATPDICSKTTTLPPGSYRSRVSAGNSAGTCLPSAVVTYPPVNQPGKDVVLCPAVPWWQSGSGSVFSQGNIQSTIPASCTPPTCINNLIQNGNSTVPGIALGGSSSSVSTGTGSVSSKNWVAQSSISGRVPDYDSFVSLIPVSITPSDPGATVGGGAFNSGGATTGDGYSWYRHNGNVTITGNIILSSGRKIIFFVDGNLTINGTITYNPSSEFFMPIVKGNIVIAPSVTTGAGTPTLTGIFYSGGSFTTGAGTAPLSVLGSVVAIGGVNMERDLGASNNFESAENYTISPELILNYPGALSFKRPIWREVAP